VAAVVIMFASFLTVSRTAVVAIAVEAVVLVPTWPRRLQAAALAGAVATVAAVRVAAPGVVGTVVGLFLHASSDDSVTHRTDDYARAAGYIAGSPLFGRGLHTFVPDQYFFIDNSYLLSILETGLIGLAATIAFFIIGASVARGARKRCRDAAGRDLGQCIAASILAAMATTATYDSFAFPMVTTLTFLLVGCAGALWRFEGGSRVHATRPVAVAAAR
jgi:O-antigen ligase